jgi:hypothetical protein
MYSSVIRFVSRCSSVIRRDHVPSSPPQRLRLSDAAKRIQKGFLDQAEQPRSNPWIRVDPVMQIRHALGQENRKPLDDESSGFPRIALRTTKLK